MYSLLAFGQFWSTSVCYMIDITTKAHTCNPVPDEKRNPCDYRLLSEWPLDDSLSRMATGWRQLRCFRLPSRQFPFPVYRIWVMTSTKSTGERQSNHKCSLRRDKLDLLPQHNYAIIGTISVQTETVQTSIRPVRRLLLLNDTVAYYINAHLGRCSLVYFSSVGYCEILLQFITYMLSK